MNRIIFFVLAFLFFCSSYCNGQDTDLLKKDFHKGRRDALRDLLPDNSFAVFFANPIRNRSNDVDFQFHQDPNFYYLTGFNESNAMLVVYKEQQDFDSVKTNEVLFIQGRNLQQEAWVGKHLSIAEASNKLGITYVLENNKFAEFKLPQNKKVFNLKFNDDVRDDSNNKGDLYSIIKYYKQKTNLDHNLIENSFALDQIMAKLREIKTAEELSIINKAIKITCDGHLELMKCLIPNTTEYQAQSIIEYCFKNAGAEYTAYPSIVGGEENSCVVHYTSNRKVLKDSVLLVVDAGAEYHGYTADVTRTLPVSGKFTESQKVIYNIVLEAQLAGIKACKNGNDFRSPHNAAVSVIQKRLQEIGIIKDKKDYLTYFFHGTSHYLGLDVHDPGLYGKLQPGNVITVEPGIYIPYGSPCDPKWWNIGVRIEDDVLITSQDPEILSGNLPKKVAEIELIMQLPGLFNQDKKLIK